MTSFCDDVIVTGSAPRDQKQRREQYCGHHLSYSGIHIDSMNIA